MTSLQEQSEASLVLPLTLRTFLTTTQLQFCYQTNRPSILVSMCVQTHLCGTIVAFDAYLPILGCEVSHSRCYQDSRRRAQVQLDIPRVSTYSHRPISFFLPERVRQAVDHRERRGTSGFVQRVCSKGAPIGTWWWRALARGRVHVGRIPQG